MVQHSKERLETKGHTRATYHCITFRCFSLVTKLQFPVPKTEEKNVKKENKGNKKQ